ncbi:MAG: metallophosphoesterase [Planctomycetota bacterium]
MREMILMCAAAAVLAPMSLAHNDSVPLVGLVDVTQIDTENRKDSVDFDVLAAANLFSVVTQNRGDFGTGFGSGGDLERGVTLFAVRDLARDNAAGGGNNGSDLYATIATARSNATRSPFAAIAGAPSGEEMNVDFSAVFFPFDAGFIGGHAFNDANNATLTNIVGAPGVSLGSSETFYDDPASSGVYLLDVGDFGATGANGVLLVAGGKNEDNYALSRNLGDGRYAIYCKDNGSDGSSYENDPVVFLYLPDGSDDIVTGTIAENSGAKPTIEHADGDFAVTILEAGRVLLRINGVSDERAGALLVSPAGGQLTNRDNVVVSSWDEQYRAYVVETRDIPTMYIEGLSGETMFSFAWVPMRSGLEIATRAGADHLVVMPDTQLYAQNHPDIFINQTQWIANNAASLGVEMVLHLGDITNRNSRSQWQVAKQAIDLLHGHVPYILAQGNHDVGPNGNGATRETLMNEYFPPSRIAEQHTHGGLMHPDHSENSFSLFEAAGRKWIVVSLEWGPRDSVLDWANTVLAQHHDRLAIIITHAHTYSDDTRMDSTVRPYGGSPYNYGTANLPGGTNDGGDIWRKLVVNHPNIMFVMSGHIKGEGQVATFTDFGNLVHELLADYQGRLEGGQGFLRLYEMTSQSDMVRVRTYSPYLDEYLTSTKSHFDLELITAPGFDGRLCRADIERDDDVDFFDLVVYLEAVDLQNERIADFDGSGETDAQDVVFVLESIGSGCVFESDSSDRER